MTVFFRSLAFHIYIYAMSFYVIAFNAFRVRKNSDYAHTVYRRWGQLTIWGLKHICNIHIAVRGGDYIPKRRALLACKHQSMLETAVLFAILDCPSMVLKQELYNIPFAKYYINGAGHIPVNRKAGSQARNFIVTQARKRFDNGQSVLIFPEGTRSQVNSAPRYRRGIFAIYENLGTECTPIALNSGLFWPRHGFLRHAGTVIFEFLPPIPAGMRESDFMTELTTKIESTVARLVQEGVAEQSALRRRTHPTYQKD
jgi:1-acyl-sn-glycerol-3-phosphate acyltransferase